jgi:type IV fimbrial biogenesis protein FimT
MKCLPIQGFYMSSKQGSITTNRGFTILELVIVMVIAAIGVALAVPTYQDVMQRRETTAQAEGLVAFMSFAQSEAIKYNELISVHLTYTDPKSWCIGANEGSAPCDCTEPTTTAPNYCSLNDVAKIMRSSEQTKSGMTEPGPADPTLVFDPIRGTMDSADLGTDHNVTLESDNGNWSLTIDIEATGRFRICNPVAANAVPGYPSC